MNRLLFFTAAITCTLCTTAQARPHLYLVTENSPPSAMMGPQGITGFATDKMRLMLERAGIDYDIDLLPWKRAFITAQTRPDTCVYSTTRVPEREALFKWVGPMHDNDWTLFGRADRSYQISSIDDARKYRIGAYNSDVRSEALIAQGFIVDTVQDNLSNPRKLLVNRIDLWASDIRVGGAILAQNGWSGKIVPVLTFKRTDLYLACHPSVPDQLIAKMNATLRAMKSAGISAAIERRYNDASTGTRR